MTSARWCADEGSRPPCWSISSARRGSLSGACGHDPLSYPEGGYGQPHHGQAIIGVADGTGVHLQVEGAPFDVRETPPLHHERILDLRGGTLHLEAEWTTPGVGGCG